MAQQHSKRNAKWGGDFRVLQYERRPVRELEENNAEEEKLKEDDKDEL